MEHRKVLVETSIIIDHLRIKEKDKSIFFRLMDNHEMFISSVTVFELFAGAVDERKKNDIDNILSTIEIIPFSSDIAKKAGELYIFLKRENKILEIRDIFIAATAIQNKLPLVTLNKDHFKRIKDISLLSF